MTSRGPLEKKDSGKIQEHQKWVAHLRKKTLQVYGERKREGERPLKNALSKRLYTPRAGSFPLPLRRTVFPSPQTRGPAKTPRLRVKGRASMG